MRTWFQGQKKWLVIASCVVVLILAGLLMLPFFVDTALIRNIVTAQLESSVHRRVAVRGAEVTIFSGIGVRLHELAISEDPRFGSTPFLRAEALRVKPRLLPLLRGKVEIGSIQVVKPVVRLIRNNAAVWNYASLSKPAEQGVRTRAPAGPVQPGGASLAIPELSLREGILSIQDRTSAAGSRENRYEHINVDLENISPTRPTSYSLEVQLPGSGKSRIKAQGKVGPVDWNQFQKTPLDSRVEFTEVQIAELNRLLSASVQSEFPWEGTLSTDTQVHGSLANAFSLQGVTTFSRLVAKRPSQDSPEISGKLQYKLNYQTDSGSTRIESTRLQLPNSDISLAGTVHTQGGNGPIDLKIDSQQVSLNDLLRIAAVFGQGAPKGIEATGNGKLNLRLGGTWIKPGVDGQASFSNGQISYPGLAEKITLSPLTLTFKGPGMSSNEVLIGVGNRTRLNAQLSGEFAPEKVFYVSLKSQNPAPVADLLAVGSSFGVALPEGFAVQNGTVNLQVRAKVSSGNQSVVNLTGRAQLAGSQVRVPSLKIPTEIRKADLNFTGDSLNVSDLAASLNGSNLTGKIQLVNFSAPNIVFGLGVDQLDLVSFINILNNPQGQGAPQTKATRQSPSTWGVSVTVYAAGPGAPSRLKDPLSTLVISDSQVQIQKVKYDALLLNNVSSRIRMKNKFLELPSLQFQMNRGTHNGHASLDFSGKQPHFMLASSLKNVDANELLSQNTSLKNMIYGTVSLDMDLKGSGSGYDQITKQLKGNGKLSLTNGRVTSFDLMEKVALLGKLTGLKSGGEAGTTINSLTAPFEVQGGRISTDALQLRSPDVTVKAAGSFGFDKSVDYRILAELPASTSKKNDLTSQIMNLAGATFFSGENGNVVVPLRMTGNISKPAFALDTEVVQENLKKRFLKGGPTNAVDTLQNLLKKKSPGSTPSSGSPTKNSAQPGEKKPESESSPFDELLKGVLDKTKKKKSEKQQ